jgi:AraC family transcriptional regulator
MPDLHSLANALDYIEAHLKDPIQVANMAQAADYSLYHFCRMFSAYVHHSPYDYLMRRRTSEAVQQLIQSRKRIIDIALEYQFNSPEVFNRAVQRCFGVKPSSIRRARCINPTCFLPPIGLEKIIHAAQVMDSLACEVQTLTAQKLSGLMNSGGYVEKFKETILAMTDSPVLIDPSQIVLHFDHCGYKPQWCYTGWQSGLVIWNNPFLPVDWERPSGRYACFLHREGLENFTLTLEWIFTTWLPQSGEKLAWQGVILQKSCENYFHVWVPIR